MTIPRDSTALQRFWDQSSTFDLATFMASIQETESTVDRASRKALLGQGALIGKFRQVKRRSKDEAIFEGGRNTIEGYNLARYLLGTYGEDLTYSTVDTAVTNSQRLYELMDNYPVVDVLLDGLDASVRDFIVAQSKYSAENTILKGLFGSRDAQGIALTFFVDGIQIALAEADEFLSDCP